MHIKLSLLIFKYLYCYWTLYNSSFQCSHGNNQTFRSVSTFWSIYHWLVFIVVNIFSIKMTKTGILTKLPYVFEINNSNSLWSMRCGTFKNLRLLFQNVLYPWNVCVWGVNSYNSNNKNPVLMIWSIKQSSKLKRTIGIVRQYFFMDFIGQGHCRNASIMSNGVLGCMNPFCLCCF